MSAPRKSVCRSPAGLLVLAATGLILSSCATRQLPIQHYALPQLNHPPVQQAAPLSGRIHLYLAPVRLAGHIDSHGLLYQSSDVTIAQAQGHRWAEDLHAQLGRALRQGLAQRLQPLRVSDAILVEAARQPDYQLHVHVERFQGRHDGYAVLSGQWSLLDGKDRLLDSRSFALEKPLSREGYTALVCSLDSAWRALIDQIASGLMQRETRLRPISPTAPASSCQQPS